MNQKFAKYFIISTFVGLYLVTSCISTIHVIEFFKLSNPDWLAISLACAFELGAAASLAALITLDKMSKGLVWALFFILTAMQAMGNAYYAYSHLHNFNAWVELFGLVDESEIYQKRVLSIISGGILPLVALGFIKSLVDYMKPSDVLVETPVVFEQPQQVTEKVPEPVVLVNDEPEPVAEIIKEDVEEVGILDKIKVFHG